MGKITRQELAPVLTAELDNSKAQINEQAGAVMRVQKQISGQDKELAFLKLKQDAADRIEGGTTFADDIQGNNFGITFNEELSVNAVIRNGGLTMNVGAMVENNVDDSVVVSGNYNTSGNGGRKLVRLDNGTLVCVFKYSTTYYLYKSVNDGSSWSEISSIVFGVSLQDVSVETDGKYIFVIAACNNATISHRTHDENGSVINSNSVISNLTALDTCSLAINEEGTELHACWSSKNSTYPNSFNIQYCKGVIGEGGTVTWGSVEQLTKANTSGWYHSYPSIIINSLGNPVILYAFRNNSDNYIVSNVYDGSSWSSVKNLVYISGQLSYRQYNPSAIFVPKSVNGLENGRIWVAWHGFDATATSTTNLRVSYSDDGGQTWSSMQKLTSESSYNQLYPTLTVNKDNEVFVLWEGAGSYMLVRQIKWTNNSWGEIEDIKQASLNSARYPNALYDTKFKTDFKKPLFIYTISATSINFSGSWTTDGYTPTTTATAVYNLPSTDYVGLFVQKEGIINITATVNDTPMDAVLEGNEYQFTKALDSEAPVTLKLSLSRENTTNGDNDKVTRILGGIS